jgi:hypothetical protein
MKPPAHRTVAVLHIGKLAFNLIPHSAAQTPALKFHVCVTFHSVLAGTRIPIALSIRTAQVNNAATVRTSIRHNSMLTFIAVSAIHDTHFICDRRSSTRRSLRSGGIGSCRNALTFDPPVLPRGTRPIADPITTPGMRTNCPNISRRSRRRQPIRSMPTCEIRCDLTYHCPRTWARSRCAKASSRLSLARARSAHCSSASKAALSVGCMDRYRMFGSAAS